LITFDNDFVNIAKHTDLKILNINHFLKNKTKPKKGICISSITVAELEYGVAKSAYPEKNKISLLEFVSIFNILNFDDNDAVEFGMIKADLTKKSIIIGPMDLLISAQA
jgi:tRNA(fMet)-specific endonuclease VapC